MKKCVFPLAPMIVSIAALSLTIAERASADAVNGELFTHHQSNGAEVQVKVWGDEYFRIVESLDGYTLVRDEKTGDTCYARLSKDGSTLVSTGVRVGVGAPPMRLAKHLRINEADMMRIVNERKNILGANQVARGLEAATTGHVQGITLIVDFSDDPGTISSLAVQAYLNNEGYAGYGNHGSVRDYFYEVSDGLLTYTNFSPMLYYRAEQTKAWYDDPNAPYGQRARILVTEALDDLDANGFDFSQYDSNDDGYIDALNVFYAGFRSDGWAEGLWPHASSISYSADGVQTARYQITDMRDSLRLSTFCHENGHMLCFWPDLYDYGGESAGVGRFCLMCWGTSGENPCEPNAYFKDRAGWATTVTLDAPQQGVPVPANANTVYKYPRPGFSNEFYMIENRQQTDRDAGIPDHGLAIWHIDTTGSNNNEQQTPESHYLVTLVQADGDWDLENDVNGGDDTDLWAAPGYVECTPDTDPNTNWWSGDASGLIVRNMSVSGDVMTFDFGDAPCPWDTAPEGGDNTIGLGDLNSLLSNWGSCPAPCGFDFAPDGGDGVVGLGDLNALLSNWGPCP